MRFCYFLIFLKFIVEVFFQTAKIPSKYLISPKKLHHFCYPETRRVSLQNIIGCKDIGLQKTKHVLPKCAISKRLRYEKQIKALHLFRLLSLKMLHRRVEIEKQHFRKKSLLLFIQQMPVAVFLTLFTFNSLLFFSVRFVRLRRFNI